MDNFKPVIAILLLICCIGFADTSYINKKINEYKVLSLYKSKTKILGFGIEDRGDYISVNDVIKNTPADKAGVLKRDIIVSLNHINVSEIDEFKETFDNIGGNQKIVLGIIREGEDKVKYLAMNPRRIHRY